MPGAGEARPNLNPFPEERIRRPLMLQSWNRLSFLHWPYDPDAVQRRLPSGVRVDTYGGKAWVGLTPFVARVRSLVAGRLLASTFPETNVRTYVIGPDGKTGVWFFSLDAASLTAVLGARAVYCLPYKWSRMRVDRAGAEVRYESSRRWPGAGPACSIAVEVGKAYRPEELGPLDHFLTARWRLYTVLRRGRLGFAQVEHPPWPLSRARIAGLEESLVTAAGLSPPEGPPLVHYSPGVEVRIGRPKRLSL